MAVKDLPIITINRQYGAYGRTIAAGLSERLGIPYFDKDFVKKTAQESGYSVEEIQRESEDISSGTKLINKIFDSTIGCFPDTYNEIYLVQKQVIMDLAKSPCIIVGRTANVVLRKAGVPTFDIFLYADADTRRSHALELDEAQGKDIDKYIQKRDTDRNNYYKQYTGCELSDCANYNICLDTGSIGPKRCEDILVGILEPYLHK